MSHKGRIILIALVAATGGLLFGFDTGVISGALPFLRQNWHLTYGDIEWVTTSVLIGPLLGAICRGKLSYSIGRKRIGIVP